MKAFKIVSALVFAVLAIAVFAEPVTYVNYYEMDGTPVYATFDEEAYYNDPANLKDMYNECGFDWTAGRINPYPEVKIEVGDFTFTRDYEGVERLYCNGAFQFAIHGQAKDSSALFVSFYTEDQPYIACKLYVFVDGKIYSQTTTSDAVFGVGLNRKASFGIMSLGNEKTPIITSEVFRNLDWADYVNYNIKLVGYMQVWAYTSTNTQALRRKEYLKYYGNIKYASVEVLKYPFYAFHENNQDYLKLWMEE